MAPPLRKRTFVIMGTRAVGKSSISLQFTENHFVDSYTPTIENTFVKNLKFGGTEYELRIVDTAGTDEQELFQETYAVGVHGYILIFSVASKASFESVKNLNMKISHASGSNNFPKVLVGNKIDLKNERQVSFEEGKALAERFGCTYIECSAKLDQNIGNVFLKLLREVEKDYATPQAPGAPAQPTQQNNNSCIMM